VNIIKLFVYALSHGNPKMVEVGEYMLINMDRLLDAIEVSPGSPSARELDGRKPEEWERGSEEEADRETYTHLSLYTSGIGCHQRYRVRETIEEIKALLSQS